jgi:hypothetical protein
MIVGVTGNIVVFLNETINKMNKTINATHNILLIREMCSNSATKPLPRPPNDSIHVTGLFVNDTRKLSASVDNNDGLSITC